MASGVLCDQAAVKDTLFCRHHSAVKLALAREKAAQDPELEHTPLALVYPEDREAIRLNLFMVLQALNNKRIDNATANTMNRLLRSCDLNKRKDAATEQNRDKAVTRVVTMPSGEEVGLPREAMERTDDPDTHGAGCPCEPCAEKWKTEPKERHHAKCRCGSCVPEVEATGGKPGAAARVASKPDLHMVAPEPYDWKDGAPEAEAGSEYQEMLVAQHQEKKAREQEARERTAMEALAAEYELRMGVEVKWKKGMKEALLDDFKQAVAEGVPYEPRAMAASAS
jgi:hypothetical protein